MKCFCFGTKEEIATRWNYSKMLPSCRVSNRPNSGCNSLIVFFHSKLVLQYCEEKLFSTYSSLWPVQKSIILIIILETFFPLVHAFDPISGRLHMHGHYSSSLVQITFLVRLRRTLLWRSFTTHTLPNETDPSTTLFLCYFVPNLNFFHVLLRKNEIQSMWFPCCL